VTETPNSEQKAKCSLFSVTSHCVNLSWQPFRCHVASGASAVWVRRGLEGERQMLDWQRANLMTSPAFVSNFVAVALMHRNRITAFRSCENEVRFIRKGMGG
jgi:hypothetical protein